MDHQFGNSNGTPKDPPPFPPGMVNDFEEGSGGKPSSNEHSPYDNNYTYKKYGFIQSKNHGANPIALDVELNKIFEVFKEKLRKDELEQQKMKVPLRARFESLKIDIDKVAIKISEIKENAIPAINKKIEVLKKEIGDIRRDPSLYQKEKPNKLSFFFGAFIGCLLTVYLWIFYTSASFSAFFRKFEADDINVANSIFDATALSKAYSQGVPAFVLVISMPFIFLALGFLIHKTNESSKKFKGLKMALLILVTFGFDYIIAFEIVQKVSELKTAASLTDQGEYRFGNAIRDMNFWLIMFAGFVTYLIWGFLFDKMMQEYEKFDLVKVQVTIREREIKELEGELKVLELQIAGLNGQQSEYEKQKKGIEEDLGATFFRTKDFEHIIYQFSSGWMQFVEGGLIANEERKNNLRTQISDVTKLFIAKNSPVPHA